MINDGLVVRGEKFAREFRENTLGGTARKAIQPTGKGNKMECWRLTT